MHRPRTRTSWTVAVAAFVFIACGGSGSTGLILPEAALFADVRETGECRDGHGTTYCLAVEDESTGIPEPGAPCDDPCFNLDPLYLFGSTGLAPEAVCAVATRPSAGAWSLEPALPVGLDDMPYAVLPSATFDPSEGSLEAALLCFDEAPESLPSRIDVLADASPNIVFVAPLL